jgi:hypothetical protein
MVSGSGRRFARSNEGEIIMRIHTIGLAAGLLIAAATAGQASTPDAARDDLVNVQSNTTSVSNAKHATDDIVIARRDRGRDDGNGNNHGRHHGDNGKDNGGKGRGGNDDGPNHDRSDDHGDHGPNHT